MEYGGVVAGTSTVVAGVATLPNTGGSRNVITYVAVASVVLGVAILASSVFRMVAKRRLSA